MATLRSCFFAYNHEISGANMDEEVKIVRVKRIDLDYEFNVCENCAKGLLASNNFILAGDEVPVSVEDISDEALAVSFEEILNESPTEERVNVEDDGGEGNN